MQGENVKIVKIGTFDEHGWPTGWHLDLENQNSVSYCLGIDKLFPGSVDIAGIEIVEWTEFRKKITTKPSIYV